MADVVTGGLEARVVVERAALDVALELPPGRTVALLGPNGAGKSTILEALAGVLPLDEGRIVFDGVVFDDAHRVFVPPAERRFGVVFQDLLLFDHLDVVENVAFGLRARGMGRTAARRRAEAWLERLELSALARRRPTELSGGEARRIALARALAAEPRALLLDEPLGAVDVTGRIGLRRVLADHLAAFPGPRLLITHDVTDAYLLGDLVVVVEGGRVVQRGTPDDIRLRPRTRFVADLAAVDLFEGEAHAGTVRLGDFELTVADTAASGAVVVRIHPRAVALHAERPAGSPRNVWRTTIDRVEAQGDRVRLRLGAPLALTAEVTPAAVATLGLRPGAAVWVAVKATEIDVEAR